MKKLPILLSISMLLMCSNLLAAAPFSCDTLKQETAKAVPRTTSKTSESQDDNSAFVAYTDDEQGSYQFTLSTDKESQMQQEETVTVAGRTCSFFRPMGDSSGGLFIPLKNNKGSLSILVMYGMFSDKTVSAADVKAIADDIDVSLFD